MLDTFSDHAKAALNNARFEAERLHHEYLGPEHFLLGLLEVSGCTAVLVLERMGVDRVELRGEIEKLATVGTPSGQTGQLPFSPGAKKALELSMEQAGNLGHTGFGTGHLLLGLIGAQDGISGRALTSQGVTLESAREQFLRMRGESYESRLVQTQRSVGLETVLGRLRSASASLQQLGELAAARRIDQVILDLQSRS